jgi:predicted ATPase/DNA-binding winged helix-turn-helix (wHTH) protein
MPNQEFFQRQATISFGAFRLSLTERRLSRHDKPVELRGRAFDILVALVERAGRVVSKNELFDIVWPNTTVEENNLRFHIASLRKALDDGVAGARYVTTVYGRGYCFVAPIVSSDGSREARSPEATQRAPLRLPAYSSRIIGREEALQDAVAQVKAKRFVTIVGPGGIGKTMLAVAAARTLLADFEGEVVFLDLAPIHDPHLVPDIVAATLGLIQSDDPVTGLIAHLRERRALLLLDSCEHIVDEVAALAERLFQETPQTHILATSREALRVEGEHIRILPPLTCPPCASGLTAGLVLSFPAAQLLIERVVASGYPFELSDAESPLVAEICRALDGIPLAIELAAGSVSAFGLPETAASLNSKVELLWKGRRTAPSRHQTLGAALDWSYHVLPDDEQTLLRRLSVLVGNFTIEAAQATAKGPGVRDDHILTALTELVAKSLVAADASGPATTYRLLDTTRTYVLDKLIESGDLERTALQHAMYFRELLERTAASPPPASDGKVFSHFGMHLGNIRAALDWAFRRPENIAVAVPLAAASGRLFMELSLLRECSRWAGRAIALLDETTRETPLEMELQAAFGFAGMHLEGNGAGARNALERSLMLAEKLKLPYYQLRLLSRLHLFHSRLGQFRTALEYAKRCEPVAREIADPLAIAEAHTVLGAARLFEGDCTSARHHFDAALVERPASSQIDAYHFGALDFRARVRIALAQALWLQGLPDQSRTMTQDTVEAVRAFNHPVTVCIVHVLAIRTFLWSRDFDSAAECLNRMSDAAEQNTLLPYQAVARAVKGELLIAQGEPLPGVAELRMALRALKSLGYQLMNTSFMAAVAEGLALAGQHQAALEVADETIELIQRGGDLFILPELLRVKGSIMLATQASQPTGAEGCFRSALDLAARQQALAWELRSAMSLARLQLDRNSRDEARRVLVPVYDRFIEGFDSPDMVAARVLLREMD